MSVRGSMSKALAALVCAFTLAIVATMLAATVAAATTMRHPRVGPLPGFPDARGVLPVLGSRSAMKAHEDLVAKALSALRAPGNEPNRELVACPEEFIFTQDVCYHGGPVLRNPTVHLVFWIGPTVSGSPSTAHVKAYPALYRSLIERYFANVAHDRGLLTDAYAVDVQYGDKTGPGVNASEFGPADVLVDEKAFPVHTHEQCPGTLATIAEGPCILDSDIQEEVKTDAVAKGWSTGLEDVFIVFTAPGVGSCAEFGCAYTSYCAYHGDFGGNGVSPGGQTIYANMPFAVPKVCDSGVHPNEALDEGTDGAIDVVSHEFNESITDPLGSQCKSKGECEPFSWTDAIGQEIGDKCLPPESTVAGTYGEPLGETGTSGGLLYNQLIDGQPYWTQTEWSNEAGAFEGRCVQRVLPTSFVAPVGAKATVPAMFDGSASGEAGDPATYWVWSFGDGMQLGTPESKVSHTYALPSAYKVTLTAYDRYGNSNTETLPVVVGPAPPPGPPTPAPEPQVITKTVSVPTFVTPSNYTAGRLAQKLGLPANGATLSGLGAISLGHSECPPACKVSLKLYANVGVTVHGKHVVRHEPIGSLTTTIAARGSGKLALRLNANGRKLLARSRKLAAQLVVTVTGQEGGSWQIVRALTLTSSGKAARRPRR